MVVSFQTASAPSTQQEHSIMEPVRNLLQRGQVGALPAALLM